MTDSYHCHRGGKVVLALSTTMLCFWRRLRELCLADHKITKRPDARLWRKREIAILKI